MVFSSLTFLFLYLPLTLLVYFLSPLRWRNFVLLVVSLLFYGWGEPVYIVIMFLSIIIDYTHGLLVEKFRSDDKKARWFVAQSVIFNLALLGFFKYWDFIAANLYLIPGIDLPQLGIPLPIGISFYTFQTMSYTIDVYRKDAPVQRNMVDFGAFVTMFPQLIAGPIVQYKTVAADLRHRLHTSAVSCPISKARREKTLSSNVARRARYSLWSSQAGRLMRPVSSRQRMLSSQARAATPSRHKTRRTRLSSIWRLHQAPMRTRQRWTALS